MGPAHHENRNDQQAARTLASVTRKILSCERARNQGLSPCGGAARFRGVLLKDRLKTESGWARAAGALAPPPSGAVLTGLEGLRSRCCRLPTA